MDNFRFFTPTEVVFGTGVENHTGALAAKHGTRALIVYGKGSVVKSGLLARVMQSLKDAGIECEEFGGAQPNPTLSHAEEGVQKALDFRADIIIGVGGGSAIDTAKGIAHGAANPGHKLWDIWTKKVPLTKSLPVGAVLTMPAAGSEMSDSAVLQYGAWQKSGDRHGIQPLPLCCDKPRMGRNASGLSAGGGNHGYYDAHNGAIFYSRYKVRPHR